MIKIFEVTEGDWIAAETVEQARECCQRVTGIGDDDCADAHELSDAELDTFEFADEPDNENSAKRTFREQLAYMIAQGEKFPCYFATSE